MDSLITAGPHQSRDSSRPARAAPCSGPLEADGRRSMQQTRSAAVAECFQLNPDPPQDFTGCVCIQEAVPQRFC